MGPRCGQSRREQCVCVCVKENVGRVITSQPHPLGEVLVEAGGQGWAGLGKMGQGGMNSHVMFQKHNQNTKDSVRNIEAALLDGGDQVSVRCCTSRGSNYSCGSSKWHPDVHSLEKQTRAQIRRAQVSLIVLSSSL